MVINSVYLVTRNARDKVQVVLAELSQEGNTFIINRTTGQYQGTMTEQPELTIERGKAKRSVLEQAELQYNSIVSKYQDKGYKRLDSLTNKKFNELSAEEMNALVPTIKSDSNGNLKPMLAKSSNDCQTSILQKKMFCSRKLNGVRMMVKWDEKLGKPITISRGGKNYDVAATLIIEQLTDYLSRHKDLILDGELYAHGHYLQEISGIARLETWEDRCEILEYWIYDIADDKRTFNNRYDDLIDLSLDIENNPNYSKIKVVEHVLTESWEQIQRLHDKWVSEGFEGLVARKPDKVYGFGKRGSDMIKVKMYQDDEFEIIDYQDGLRPEDFTFVCQTKEGKQFAAKPIGDRELKAQYLENIDKIIGKKGIVKYFEISKDGIPLQPVFQAVRYDL